MRILFLLLIALFATACPPSAAQVKTARAARYRAAPDDLFRGAEEAARGEGYKIADENAETAVFITAEKIFGPGGETESSGAGGTIQVADNSIVLAFLVRVRPADDAFAIEIEPKIRRMRTGRSNLDELAPDDPGVPTWVHGKADALAVAIHGALAPYAAAT